jgi:hypothetical protein
VSSLFQRPYHADAGADDAEHEHDGDPRARHHSGAIALDELPQAIRAARRAGEHGFVREVTLYVRREVARGRVTARAILLETLHHDPVEIAAQERAHARGVDAPSLRRLCGRLVDRGDACARRPRLLVSQDAHDLEDPARA